MSRLKSEVIKYSKKLNITNLSALRSGNISVRTKEKGVDGFFITPSGRKYGSLKPNDNIVLVITGSSHRSDSMSANEFIMDFLKSSAPFWKKEIYPDKEIWVEQKESDLRKLYKWENF